MPDVYENKRQDSFPNVSCYVPWQSQFFSRWMPGVYFHKCQDSFPNIYCYVPWKSQFVLDGCLAFMKLIARTLFPTSTAMSLDISVCYQLMHFIYFHKRQDFFPNIYCYVPWQSQFVLDGCLAFMKINTRTPFPTSTAMSLDSRSLFLMDAWLLFS